MFLHLGKENHGQKSSCQQSLDHFLDWCNECLYQLPFIPRLHNRKVCNTDVSFQELLLEFNIDSTTLWKYCDRESNWRRKYLYVIHNVVKLILQTWHDGDESILELVALFGLSSMPDVPRIQWPRSKIGEKSPSSKNKGLAKPQQNWSFGYRWKWCKLRRSRGKCQVQCQLECKPTKEPTCQIIVEHWL